MIWDQGPWELHGILAISGNVCAFVSYGGFILTIKRDRKGLLLGVGARPSTIAAVATQRIAYVENS